MCETHAAAETARVWIIVRGTGHADSHVEDGTLIAFDRSGTGQAVILVGGALSDRSSATYKVEASCDLQYSGPSNCLLWDRSLRW